MNKWVVTALIAIITSSSFATVFDHDDRDNVNDSIDYRLEEIADSTLAQIPKKLIKKQGNGITHIKGELLKNVKRGWKLFSSKTLPMCKSVRFTNQITSANCSGFLVAPDLIVTAGHCLDDGKCSNKMHWVFGYRNSNRLYNNNKVIEIETKDVYSCKTVLEYSPGIVMGRFVFGPVSLPIPKFIKDYAIVRLNRKVQDHIPLVLRSKGIISSYAEVATIGHSIGLPALISDKGSIIENSAKDHFITDLDIFGGNSGGVVVNSTSIKVEGILVRGCRKEFIPNKSRTCLVVNKTKPTERCSSDVTRIGIIPNLKRDIQKSYDRN